MLVFHPDLPGASFWAMGGGCRTEDGRSVWETMSIRSWNCPSNDIHPKDLNVDDGRCRPKLNV